jgi:hypothetical protein
MSSHHHHHKRKSHYSFRNFTHDISKPFMTVEKDVVGIYHHGISTFGKIGSSVGTPLLIIGAFGIAFLVLNRGSLR